MRSSAARTSSVGETSFARNLRTASRAVILKSSVIRGFHHETP
jgi:hypothetical protein